MSRPVVLFVIDTLNMGGAERSLLDMLPRFKRYKPVVCQVYQGDELKQAFINAGVEVQSLQLPKGYHFRKGIAGVHRLLKEVKPSIIHSSLFKSDIISRYVSKGLNIPLISSLVNNSYHESRFMQAGLMMKAKLRIVQLADAYTARYVSQFISNSEAIRQSNATALGIPLSKIKVIYRGRDARAYGVSSPSEKENVKEKLGLQGKKLILNVSRLLERKGQLDLVKAMPAVLNKFPEAVLLIAGEGPFRARLEEEVQHLQLQDHVRLLGTRKDIPQWLSIADCFAFPSYYEGLPGALIEAMMTGLPIVASSIPENQECVTQESAMLFSPGDVAQMAKAINHIMEDADHAQRLAKEARAVAQTKFELDAVVQQYEDTYDAFMQRK